MQFTKLVISLFAIFGLLINHSTGCLVFDGRLQNSGILDGTLVDNGRRICSIVRARWALNNFMSCITGYRVNIYKINRSSGIWFFRDEYWVSYEASHGVFNFELGVTDDFQRAQMTGKRLYTANYDC